jgi:predicted glycogen debranching enzyme
MPEIRTEANTCLFPQDSLNLEWLDTNGLGGYASSTVINCHTRKYHGLLVANLGNPAGRSVILSKFEDSLCLGEEEHFFSCHQYPGFFFQGPGNCLDSFQNDTAPRFTYRIGETVLRKTIMFLHGENCVLIRYDVENCPSSSFLRIRPFLAFRGFHTLANQNPLFDTNILNIKNGFKIQPYCDMPALFIRSNVNAHFSITPHWYYNFEYSAERDRGYEWREDLFQSGVLKIPITSGKSAVVAVSFSIINTAQIKKKWESEETRRLRLKTESEIPVAAFPEEDRENIRLLLKAGRQFLITTPSGRPAAIAGYHWFDDWGRDTLISLPGLTFCSGRPHEGIAILDAIGKHEKNGLLPNFFSPDENDNAYNTVDASLWYFWAVQQMLKFTGDIKIIESSMWHVMKRIIKNFMNGTTFDIHMSDNGLLHTGNAGTHLTWMDAVVDGRPVTSRWGYAVEINALWYNALCFARELAGRFGEDTLFSPGLIPRVSRSFQDTFWIEDGAYLGDVFSGGSLDRAIRPNQIFALSLPFSPLSPSQAAGVLNNVREHLLTPCGLRTLSPDDRAYQGRYEGGQEKRDGAYHQGTVWPWLLGAFGEACLKLSEDKSEAKNFLREHLRYFLRAHLQTAGLGCISEIFDGDPPHRPRGCISQAWSVGELIRLYTLLTEF